MPDVEGEEAAPLGERPASDELALNVAQARIAAKLFGSTGEVTVGRYKLLELVGRGGMGVVWGAWDPELERRVAIKLVDHLRPDARERIVREARALAKLSHPHVVPVHDVGVVDDRVYLVMEWIAGETLRAYKPRSERDIVEVYMQAARGLGAIHAAGLVHRDFKPDNAMIGRDHRVRVLDLGLARGDLETQRRDVAGTPRYMAPEQVDGVPPTPAVDQFALCVSLREALEARGVVPRWLAAIIARGTSTRPEDRFPSMDDVIRALGRDPSRVWRRRIIAGVALAATATAFVVGRAAKEDPCSSPHALVLDASARARIATHLESLGPFAQGERGALLALLERHERGLHEMHRAACISHDRGDLTTAFYERRLTCLARAESSLRVAAEILGQVTAASFPDARVAAGALADPTHCTRVDQSLVPLPEVAALPAVRETEAAVERARLLATAARPDAIPAAEQAREAAQSIGYLPLVARALLVEGRAQLLAEDARARATLEQSWRTGFAAHDDASAVEAFARMLFAASRAGETVDGTTLIDAVASRLGPDGTFARLLLLNNLATVRMSTSDDVTVAAPLLETAMRDWQPGASENDFELVSIPQNLAMSISDPARSVELLGRARTAAVRVLGEHHPRVLEIDRMQALFGDLESARATYDRSCKQLASLFPELVARRAECEYQAGWLADEAGDGAAATAHFRAAPLDPKSRRAQVAAAMIELAAGGDAKQLATQLERDAVTDANAPFLFTRAVAADLYIAAARAWQVHGDHAAELRCWDGARRLLEAIERPAFARRLARARAALEK